MAGKCVYNAKWETNPTYKDWLKRSKRTTARYCAMCVTATAADSLCEKAELTGQITFVTQANSLKRTAKEKVKDVESENEKLKQENRELQNLLEHQAH